jgi:hypothetical protein
MSYSYRMECINTECGRILLAEGNILQLKKSTFILCSECYSLMRRMECMEVNE